MRLPVVVVSLCLVVCATEASIDTISSTDRFLVVEISTGVPRLMSVNRGGKPYLQLESEGASSHAAPGHPEIPTVSATVIVPPGTRLELDVDRSEERPIPLPADLAFRESIPSHCGNSHRVSRDAGAYGRTYGDSGVEIEELGFAASDRIATVRFWPFRYDPAKKTLRWTPRLKVRFRFETSREPSEKPPVKGKGRGVAHYVALNPSLAGADARLADKIDLIIAHGSYQYALQRYIDFKRQGGRQVREHYVSGKTAQQIKDIIKQEYQSATPPTGTLLFGNIDQIPAWKGSGDNGWTDYPHTTLDSDAIPDISLGRVPAHSIEELMVFVDKAVAREREPRDVDHILITAGKDQSLGCPANVTKVGEKIKAAAGSVKIVKKFKTEVNTQAVIDGYNENPNIIVYDGHGNRQGMTEVPLLISGLEQLTNRVFPIVLDIACLNANWGSGASPRNFAESILLKPEKGIAGIMASGGSGYGHDFFKSIGEIMATARKNIDTDPKMNEIGQVILAAKIKHGAQDRAYWNYYGDPASSVWESTMQVQLP